MSMRSTSSRGFTLIELVMVLSILAILSMLAVHKLNTSSDGLRWQKSEEVLDRVEEAIVGDTAFGDGVLRDRAGDVIFTSFVSDMGRLPCARPRAEDDPRDDRAGVKLTLVELFSNVSGAPPYGLYDAVSNNFARKYAPVSADRGVRVAMGWKGPYMRTNQGLDGHYVRDGWKKYLTADAWEWTGADGRCAARILPGWAYDQWTNSLGLARLGGQALSNGFEIAVLRNLGGDLVENVTREALFAVTNDPAQAVNRDAVRDLRLHARCQSLSWNIETREGFAADSFGLRVYYPKDGRIGVFERLAQSGSAVGCELPVGRKTVRAWAAQGNVTNYSAVLTRYVGRVGELGTIRVTRTWDEIRRNE